MNVQPSTPTEDAPVLENQPKQPPSPQKSKPLLLFLIAILIILSLGSSAFLYYRYWTQGQTAPVKPPTTFTLNTPTPSPQKPTIPLGWQTYTSQYYGFSFSYPPSLTLGGGTYCGPDSLICTGDLSKGSPSGQPVLEFLTMSDGPGSYCYSGGSMDLKTTPVPTDPMKIAEAQASCGCDASGTQTFSTCSQASNEQTITADSGITSYQFSLQQDSYAYQNNKIATTGSQIRGPYRAFFLPKTLTVGGTRQLGVYFLTTDPTEPALINQILSTFVFTNGVTPTPTCRPRPPCLDATPRCLIPETSDMCPPTPTSTACTSDADCPTGQSCVVWGPIVINGTQNKKCVAPGTAVPL